MGGWGGVMSLCRRHGHTSPGTYHFGATVIQQQHEAVWDPLPDRGPGWCSHRGETATERERKLPKTRR